MRKRTLTSADIVGGVIAVSLIAVYLFAFVVGSHPYSLVRVETGSMAPTILPKSLVIVERGHYRLGQVATFDVNGVRETHRITYFNKDGTISTKGDANRTEDPWVVQSKDVLGGAVYQLSPRNQILLSTLIVFLALLWLLPPQANTEPYQRPARMSRNLRHMRDSRQYVRRAPSPARHHRRII